MKTLEWMVVLEGFPQPALFGEREDISAVFIGHMDTKKGNIKTENRKDRQKRFSVRSIKRNITFKSITFLIKHL